MYKTKKVRLFRRSLQKKTEPINQLNKEDEQKLHIEQLGELLMKTTRGEYQTEKKKLTDELAIIRKQIQDAKAQYDKTMTDLVPLKWELVDKKSELIQVQDQYKQVLARLKNAKEELQLMAKKLEKAPTG